MYSSLDRIDIVATGPDGREHFVQTDHRSADEVRAEREISVLFAIARMLAPRRGEPDACVVYSARYEPPEFLRAAVEAAGGVLTVDDVTLPEHPGVVDAAALDRIAGDMLAALAWRAADELGLKVDLDGLSLLEWDLSSNISTPDQDEVGYWRAVMGLGAVAGEIIRDENGGSWATTGSGALPFVLNAGFRGGTATVNPLGKAIKRFANGEEDSVVALVETVLAHP